MFCGNCGSRTVEGNLFCVTCGQAQLPAEGSESVPGSALQGPGTRAEGIPHSSNDPEASAPRPVLPYTGFPPLGSSGLLQPPEHGPYGDAGGAPSPPPAFLLRQAEPQQLTMASQAHMPFLTAIETCFRKYVVFSGRARRSEYWWFVLFYGLVYGAILLLTFIPAVIRTGAGLASLAVLFLVLVLFASLVPMIAVSVRRLHDTGLSAWWVLLSLIPIANLAMIPLCLQDSSTNVNKYGPPPKAWSQ
jgi:uncharacterized membrane protein YhaH (DUF805 family)